MVPSSDLGGVSVVVPVYNELSRLPSRMGAFLELADRGAEVIFVDDGSTDGTLDFLQANIAESSGVRVEQLETNRGKGAAVRRGVHVASRDYFCVEVLGSQVRLIPST